METHTQECRYCGIKIRPNRIQVCSRPSCQSTWRKSPQLLDEIRKAIPSIARAMGVDAPGEKTR